MNWPFGNQKSMEFKDLLVDYMQASKNGDAWTSQRYNQIVGSQPVDIRIELVASISQVAEENQGTDWQILIPPIAFDIEHRVVSTAALDLAVLMPLDEGDELTGPMFLFKMAEEIGLNHPRSVAILSGLLLLGDVRVLPILQIAWNELNSEHRNMLAGSWSGLTARATILMILNWLETEKDENVYGALAGTLARMAKEANEGKILDIIRTFPAYEGTPIQCIGVQDVKTFGMGIKPRLEALANSETGDRIMPLVIQAWIGDEHPEELIKDKSSPTARAQRFTEGLIEPDLAGSRMVDSNPYWMRDDPITGAAILSMMQRKVEANEQESQVPWFSVLRECVAIGVDRGSLEAWCSYTFLAAAYHTILQNNSTHTEPDAESFVESILAFLCQENDLSVSFRYPKIKILFDTIHEDLDIGASEKNPETAIISYTKVAFKLGEDVASKLSGDQKKSIINALNNYLPHEKLIYPIAHRTISAQTTGELAISPTVRYCKINYVAYPEELNVFASYFQEAEEAANLSFQKSSVQDWVQDASLYFSELSKLNPETPLKLLQERGGPSRIESTINLFKSINQQLGDNANNPLAIAKYYWEKVLRRDSFGVGSGPQSFDQVTTSVDLIGWWALLKIRNQ